MRSAVMNVEEFKAYVFKKKNGEDLNEISTLILNLEKRIADIKKSLPSASGWAVKESLRHSLRVNEGLLLQAKKLFWEENL
jgi:hypothetical protein